MNPALLVIDVQRYFFERSAPAFLKYAPKILPNIIRLINTFRAAKLPIVFTRHAHKRGSDTGQMGRWWKNKLPWEGVKTSELVSAIRPERGELFITKTRYSALEKTQLESWLKKRNVDTVVLCGVMTNLCLETTARHAFMKNFQPVVVEDACAANTRAHHRASILNLKHGFAVIEKTGTAVKKIWTPSTAQ